MRPITLRPAIETPTSPIIADYKQARDTYQESLRGIVAEQSASSAKLITCLESNTRVLEECRHELRHSRLEWVSR